MVHRYNSQMIEIGVKGKEVLEAYRVVILDTRTVAGWRGVVVIKVSNRSLFSWYSQKDLTSGSHD